MTGERGFAVLLALMALVILSTLGAGMVAITSIEPLVGSAFRASIEARFAARAIAERAFIDLAVLPSWDPVLNGSAVSSFTDGAPGGARPLLGGFTADLTQLVSLANCGQPAGCTPAATTAITAARPWGSNNPRWRLYAWGPIESLEGDSGAPARLYLVALVGDDGAENDGDPDVDGVAGSPGEGRVLLRGMAVGPRGVYAGVEVALSRGAAGAVNVTSVNDLQR
jgi:hypothetical protein